MSPEEARGRELSRRALIGLVWFLVELCVLAIVIRCAGNGDDGLAYGVGIFLILLCYFEGRIRKK